MSKKRVSLLALLVAGALGAAGAAVAASTHASATAVTATFAATSVTRSHTNTCTSKGGDSFQGTTAVYKGTSSSSDPRLNGALTIKAHSFVDTTSGLGRLTGIYRINGAQSGAVTGVLSGVISNGTLSGLVRGAAKGPEGQLLATLGGTFGQTTGFSAGTLGSATTGAGAVITNGYCSAGWHGKK